MSSQRAPEPERYGLDTGLLVAIAVAVALVLPVVWIGVAILVGGLRAAFS